MILFSCLSVLTASPRITYHKKAPCWPLKTCHFLHHLVAISLFLLSSCTCFSFPLSFSVDDSLYNSHLSVRSSVADCALFNPSHTSSNWSADRAISVLALPSDKGQTPFPEQAAEKGGHVQSVCWCVCVCVCVCVSPLIKRHL